MKSACLCLIFLLATTVSSIQSNPLLSQPIHYLPYAFGFSTSDGVSRQEQGHNGVVTGSYSYTDPNGDLRQVKYTADAHGYRPEGDIGVDRRTAEAAAALAALAPKGPVAPSPGATYHVATPSPAVHWTPTAPNAPVPFKSYNTFEKLIGTVPAPEAFHGETWNHGANYRQGGPHLAAGQVGGYQVDTPTHKIWVRY